MNRSIVVVALAAGFPLAVLAEPFSADVWADNWFEMRINGEQVAEDSVPITTERSFNAESFTFDAARPFTIAVMAKDFRQDDTGLEYIGTRRQQMGDGGMIVQIRNGAGATVAVSNAGWQCLTIHTAPLDKSCEDVTDPEPGVGACAYEILEEPQGWDSPGFDASDWPQAAEYPEQAVSPKGGYDQITWSDEARFIWGPDLEQSNTILCRLTVD